MNTEPRRHWLCLYHDRWLDSPECFSKRCAIVYDEKGQSAKVDPRRWVRNTPESLEIDVDAAGNCWSDADPGL